MPMNNKKCETCGRPFVPVLPHHRQCPDCARGRRAPAAAVPDHAPGDSRRGTAGTGSAPSSRPRTAQSGGSGDGRLPAGYLNGGYFDDAGNLRPELLTDVAQEVARALGHAGMANAQLRRFFGKVRMLETRLLSRAPFDSLRAEIVSLQPNAASAVARAVAPELFKGFVDANVPRAAADERAFLKGFIPHFEAVVAYFRYFFPRK